MANTNNVTTVNVQAWPKMLQRTNHFLMDFYGLQANYSAILSYAESNPAAAVGQIIYAQSDDTTYTDKKAGLYVIKSYGTGAEIERVGSGSVGSSAITASSYSDLTSACDGTHAGTVVVIESSISNGESGDAAKTYAPGLYIVGTGNTIASLKSLSTSASDGSSVVDQLNALDTRVGSLESVVGNSSSGLVKAVNLLAGAQANVIETVKVNGTALTVTDKAVNVEIPSASEYSLVKDSSSDDYSAVYHLTKDGTNIGEAINIPKDMVVSSGQVVTKAVAGDWGEAGLYIELTLANAENDKLYIPAAGLVEYITGGSTSEISITVDSSTHVATANLLDGSIAKSRLTASLKSEIEGKVDRKITTSAGVAYIFNESDGGGAKFERANGEWSFVGVNSEGEIGAQIYHVDYSGTAETNSNYKKGTRINVTKSGIYYTNGNQNASYTADDEIATKGDLSVAIANIQVNIDNSTIKKDASNNLYVSTANLAVGTDESLGVVKNGGNVEIQSDGSMLLVWSE